MKKFKVDKENDDNEQMFIADSNANIRLTPKQTDNVDNRFANVTEEFKAKRSKGEVSDEENEELPDLEAADVAAAALKIQSAYKGFKTRLLGMSRKITDILKSRNFSKIVNG